MPDCALGSLWNWPRGWDYPSQVLSFDLRIQYSHIVPPVPPISRKRKASSPDATTDVQFADASEIHGVQLEDESEIYGVQLGDASKIHDVQLGDENEICGVCTIAVEDKSSGSNKRKAPPPYTTTSVQLVDASDLEGLGARPVEDKSSGTNKYNAPPPDTTTDVQLTDASDLEGMFAKAVEDKPSGIRKRKAPPLDTTTGVQLADASDLEGMFVKAVEDKPSGTRKRKAPPLDTTTGVQLADASDLEGVFVRAVKHKSSGTSECNAAPPDTTSGVQLPDVSYLKGIYARAIKDRSSRTITRYKYEPRFTPPREKVDGTTRKLERLSLGEYRTCDEAKIVLQIARFYYDKDQGCVELDDGQFKFFIPPMNKEEQGFAGEKKRKWVTEKAKEVYANLRNQKQNLKQLSVGNTTGARSSHDSDIGVSEVPFVSSANALEVPSCPVPLPSCDVVADYCETFSGLSDMIDDALQCLDSPNFLPQQSSLNCEMHFVGFGQILGGPSSPQVDGVTQVIQDSVDAHLSPQVDFQQGGDLISASGPNFFGQPRDPALQQMVHRQKQELEVCALQIVDLKHQLWESQTENLVLRQEIERLTCQFLNGSLT